MPDEMIRVYECLCDETRLRILNLLGEGPLCVCHFQEILAASQVKISRHLAYMRERKMVEVEKVANWRVYRLPRSPSSILAKHLACLSDCAKEEAVFRTDLRKRQRLEKSLGFTSSFPAGCCAKPAESANFKLGRSTK